MCWVFCYLACTGCGTCTASPEQERAPPKSLSVTWWQNEPPQGSAHTNDPSPEHKHRTNRFVTLCNLTSPCVICKITCNVPFQSLPSVQHIIYGIHTLCVSWLKHCHSSVLTLFTSLSTLHLLFIIKLTLLLSLFQSLGYSVNHQKKL